MIILDTYALFYIIRREINKNKKVRKKSTWKYEVRFEFIDCEMEFEEIIGAMDSRDGILESWRRNQSILMPLC